MIRLITLFLISSSLWASSPCSIEFYPQSYYNSLFTPVLKDVVKNSNCNTKILKDIEHLIHTSNTHFYADHLERIITETTGMRVTIKPKTFRIAPLKELLSLRLKDSNKRIAYLNFNFQQIINLDSNQQLKITNFDSKQIGKQTVKINLYTNNRVTKTFWGTTEIDYRTNAAITLRPLTPYSALADTKIKPIWVRDPRQYFTDFKHLKFYQTIHSLQIGEAIKIRDVTPKTLVKAGIPTKVILHNKAIRLSTVALPYQNGKWGDSITLRNMKSGKKIQATVSDINEVTIKL
jgi:flagella basal body P-ring formation protein FlgA